MAAARRLPASPPLLATEPERWPGWEVPAAEGKMAAATVLVAGLCVARRAVAVAGPRGAQRRREGNEPAMNDALHRPGHRGRHRSDSRAQIHPVPFPHNVTSLTSAFSQSLGNWDFPTPQSPRAGVVYSTELLPPPIQGTGVKIHSKRSDVTPRHLCVKQGNCIKTWIR
eukprot:XP_028349634.1 histidine triad nucleotide-binding protein 2, mitochondrial isoform X7 [Physeter catodon]